MDTFGDIRSLLQLPPTPERWSTLCDLVDRVPARQMRDLVLPYARDHLTRWPDPLRMAPWRWIVQTFTESPPRGWPLARHVSFAPAAPLNNSWTERVAASPHLADVTHLSLTSCHIGGEKLGRILDAPCLPRLRGLNLSFNHIRDDGLRGITRTQRLERLRTLRLASNGIIVHGVKFLGDSQWWPGLRTLDLGHNNLSPRALDALAGALDVGALEHLDLSHNRHGLDHVPSLSKLVDAPGARSLRSLDLSQNPMTSEHIRALTRSPNLASLRKLDVSISLHHRDTPPLEPSDLLAFRTCAFSRQLRELSLAGHAVDDDGIRALVDGDELRGLTHLNLLSNGIGDRGARALANANLPDLVHLDLGQNRLTSRGIHALAHAENLVALEHIDLRGNRDVSLDDIDLLRRAPALPQLSSILA